MGETAAGSYAGGHAVVNAALTPQAAEYGHEGLDAIGNNPNLETRARKVAAKQARVAVRCHATDHQRSGYATGRRLPLNGAAQTLGVTRHRASTDD